MSTESDNQSVTEGENAYRQSSPGQLLAEQREQRGLSQKQVADKLRITTHFVEAIETDDYDKLPDLIFVRGYLKRYAEILELDAALLLDRFEEEQQSQLAYKRWSIRRARRKRLAKKLGLALLTLLLGAGIFAGLGFWQCRTNPESGLCTAVMTHLPFIQPLP